MEQQRSKKPRKRRDQKRRESRAPTAAALLCAKPVVDEAKSVEEPLSREEVSELRMHFRFLAKWRKPLRLKPNAAEDRLLNGSQEPTHRGVCLHLLGKVDRSAVQGALSRIAEATERTRLLEGVVRFSNDAAILLLYLESLSETSSPAEAASALAAGLGRIDFDQVSAAQMRRVLELIVQRFPAMERPTLLLGLLQNQSFCTAFDALDMPRDLAELLIPIRAVHAEVFADGNERCKPEDLARGVWLSLGASDETLCAHPESARRRLFELGLELDEDVDHALTVLLDSFPATGRTYSSLAMARASQWLRRHDDERACELLNNIKTHHPGFRLPGRWLALLDAPRIGRIALRERGASDAWQRGFWLDRQRPVLVRTRSQDERSAVAREVELRRLLTVPSVTPLLVSCTQGSTVFIAVEAVGRPAKWWHRLRQLDRRQILALAREGVTLLATVFRVGVAMPDADPTRFLLDDTGRLWLLDLWGAQATDTPDAAFVLARSWCNTILEKSDRPPGLRRLLAEADSLASLHEILATY